MSSMPSRMRTFSRSMMSKMAGSAWASGELARVGADITRSLLADKAQNPLAQFGRVVAAVDTAAHVIRLATLQALVQLVAGAKGALHQVRRHGQQAQMVARAGRLVAEQPLDIHPDFGLAEIAGAAGQDKRAGEDVLQQARGPIRGLNAMQAMGFGDSWREEAA